MCKGLKAKFFFTSYSSSVENTNNSPDIRENRLHTHSDTHPTGHEPTTQSSKTALLKGDRPGNRYSDQNSQPAVLK